MPRNAGKLQDLEQRLQILAAQRKILEKRSAEKQNLLHEFNRARNESLSRLVNALDSQNDQAKKRNEEIMQDLLLTINQSEKKTTSLFSGSGAGARNDPRVRLDSAKKDYVKFMEASLPMLHRSETIRLEEKMKQIKLDKLESIQRRERLRQELLKEERIRYELEQQRRELMQNLALEQSDLLQARAQSLYISEEGKMVDAEVVQQMDALSRQLSEGIHSRLVAHQEQKQQQMSSYSEPVMLHLPSSVKSQEMMDHDASHMQQSTRHAHFNDENNEIREFAPYSRPLPPVPVSQNNDVVPPDAAIVAAAPVKPQRQQQNYDSHHTEIAEEKSAESVPINRYPQQQDKQQTQQDALVLPSKPQRAAVSTVSTASDTTTNFHSVLPNVTAISSVRGFDSDDHDEEFAAAPAPETVAVVRPSSTVTSQDSKSGYNSNSSTIAKAILPVAVAAPRLDIDGDEFEDALPGPAMITPASTTTSSSVTKIGTKLEVKAETNVKSKLVIDERDLPRLSDLALDEFLGMLQEGFQLIERRIDATADITSVYMMTRTSNYEQDLEVRQAVKFLLNNDKKSAGVSTLVIARTILTLLQLPQLNSGLMAKNAFTGVVTIDKLKKEWKKSSFGSVYLSIWDSILRHLQALTAQEPERVDYVAKCYTVALIAQVDAGDHDRMQRKVMNLLQLEIVSGGDSNTLPSDSPYRRGTSVSSNSKTSSMPVLSSAPVVLGGGNSNNNFRGMTTQKVSSSTTNSKAFELDDEEIAGDEVWEAPPAVKDLDASKPTTKSQQQAQQQPSRGSGWKSAIGGKYDSEHEVEDTVFDF